MRISLDLDLPTSCNALSATDLHEYINLGLLLHAKATHAAEAAKLHTYIEECGASEGDRAMLHCHETWQAILRTAVLTIEDDELEPDEEE